MRECPNDPLFSNLVPALTAIVKVENALWSSMAAIEIPLASFEILVSGRAATKGALTFKLSWG